MESGNMNKRITFQALTTTTNENGLEMDEWTDYYSCWCSVNNLYGTEYWNAQQVQEENTVNFYVRYCRKLSALDTKNYRIMFEDKPFDIKHIDNVQYANDLLKVKALASTGEVD